MQVMTIGEVAREANVKTSTLRYYETIGLLDPPQRLNGQRRYDNEALKRLTIIQTAKEAGFTLKEIETLLSGLSADAPPSKQWKSMAVDKLSEIDEMISRANRMKMLLKEGMECECLSLDECVVYLNGRD